MDDDFDDENIETLNTRQILENKFFNTKTLPLSTAVYKVQARVKKNVGETL